MQVHITPKEKEQIKVLSSGYGAVGWFLEKTGISYTPFDRMRTLGRAEDAQVRKVRTFLATKEAKQMLAQKKEAAGTA